MKEEIIKYAYDELDFEKSNNIMIYEETYAKLDLKKIGKCKINIYSGEGQIAHFHIEKDGFCCCVCLNHNKYFIHPGKEDTLNSTARKKLNDYLHEINPETKLTNWQSIQQYYYRYNPNTKEKRIEIQPDYTKMSESIH